MILNEFLFAGIIKFLVLSFSEMDLPADFSHDRASSSSVVALLSKGSVNDGILGNEDSIFYLKGGDTRFFEISFFLFFSRKHGSFHKRNNENTNQGSY